MTRKVMRFHVLVFALFLAVLWPGELDAMTTSEKLGDIASLEDLRADCSVVAKFLLDKDPVVRSRAALALGRIQDTSSVQALLPLVKDASADVRGSVAFALGQVGLSSGFSAYSAANTVSKALIKLLSDPAPNVRVAAAEALGKTRSRQAVHQLSRLLSASDTLLSQQAALSLAFVRDSTALPALYKAAGSRDEGLRWRVAYALENIPHTNSVSVLSHLARDKSWLVRSFAARALGKIEDERSLSILTELLPDEDWHVAVNAARSLGSFKNEKSASALLPALGVKSSHVRAAACASLGKIGLEKTADFLRVLLSDRSPYVRAEALRAFLLCSKETAAGSASSLLQDRVWFVRASAYETLAEAGIPMAARVLREAYEYEPDRRARASCILGIGKAKDETTLSFLSAASADTDMVVVACVCEALGEIGNARAAGLVKEIYEKWKDYPEPDVKLSAIEALRKLKAVAALPIYRECLFDKDRRAREVAYGALKELWGSYAADSLRALSQLAFPAPTRIPEGYRTLTHSSAGTAVIKTERGDIVIRLLGDEAPNTVENFARLAERGFYNGLTVHRVVPNFVIQDGCPRGDGWGGPGYTIRCEINRKHYLTGTVGMALSGKDTGGSQFFITHSPQPHLDGRYTVFGEVINGMDIVDSIERGDKILGIEVTDQER